MYMANRASELFPGASFAVAHCNFCLRGAESDGDERFVEQWCARAGVRCHVQRFDTAGYAAEHGVSIEMAARELRYAWFARLCSEEGFDAVATAHNANDNAETLMLNLLRGTGLKGLRGLSASRSFEPHSAGMKILRPLLDTERREIEEWMVSHDKQWREDRTNGESVVKRNIIRNEVFPIFGRINPSFVKTLNADMRRFAQVDDIAEDYFLCARRKVVKEAGEREEQERICVKELLALRHWKYVLWRLLEPYGFSQQTFSKLLCLLEAYKDSPRGTVTMSGKTFESPAHILVTSRSFLVLLKRQA